MCMQVRLVGWAVLAAAVQAVRENARKMTDDNKISNCAAKTTEVATLNGNTTKSYMQTIHKNQQPQFTNRPTKVESNGNYDIHSSSKSLKT